MKTGGSFVLEIDRCTGCSACVLACANENPVSEGLAWRTVHTYNEKRLQALPVVHYSLACNHCLDAACMSGCPANAYRRDSGTGAVLLDGNACMGCRYCLWVCPYEAPSLNRETSVMEKCTWCVDRQHDGLEPSCVVACPTSALRFEPLIETAPIAEPGFPETGLRPAIRVQSHQRTTAPPSTLAGGLPAVAPPPTATRWNRLRDEWSLWVFSSAAALLVAWFSSGLATGQSLSKPIFVTIGCAAMIISLNHIGRWSRFWRAALNVRRSWVSREIFLFLTFFGAACVLPASLQFSWIGWLIAGVGLASLFSMDMVYRVQGQSVMTVPHSAMAILSAALYIGLLVGSPVLMWPAAAVKAILYLLRPQHPPPGIVFFALLRIGIGLVLPCLVLIARPDFLLLALTAAIVGELMDRAEFYAALQFPGPGSQIENDLARAARSLSQ